MTAVVLGILIILSLSIALALEARSQGSQSIAGGKTWWQRAAWSTKYTLLVVAGVLIAIVIRAMIGVYANADSTMQRVLALLPLAAGIVVLAGILFERKRGRK